MRRAWVVLFLIGCSAIKPYSARIDLSEGASPALPVGMTLEAYDSILGKQWTETANRCTQVELAVAEEIDDRQRRLTSTKRWLLGIGSLAALATTIYTGVAEDPKTEVIVPLAAIGGTATATAIPALTEDERVTALQGKLVRIGSTEGVAIAKLNAIEAEIQKRTIIGTHIDRETKALDSANANAQPSIQASLDSLWRLYDAQEMFITPFEAELRRALAAWFDGCR